MLVEQRRNRLLELVKTRKFASLPDLAEELQVSESTVRRDLDHLEDMGVAKRFHGGVLYSGGSPKLPHFETRHLERWEQKRIIASQAVKLIDDGDTVLLDGGSTTYEVARLLVGRPLHVVTTSLPVAELLASDRASDLIMVGGNVCPRTGVVQGPKAVEMIRSLPVRKTVLSVAGIHDDGFFNNNLTLVETEQAMMAAAEERVIVVADSSKFGHRSMARLCSLGDVTNLVVDNGITEDWRSKVVATGVKLSIAGPTDNG